MILDGGRCPIGIESTVLDSDRRHASAAAARRRDFRKSFTDVVGALAAREAADDAATEVARHAGEPLRARTAAAARCPRRSTARGAAGLGAWSIADAAAHGESESRAAISWKRRQTSSQCCAHGWTGSGLARHCRDADLWTAASAAPSRPPATGGGALAEEAGGDLSRCALGMRQERAFGAAAGSSSRPAARKGC